MDRAVWFKHDGLFEKGAEARWIAVRGQAHDLVLVGVKVKAQMESHERIQDPDRVIRRDLVQLLQLVVSRVINRGTVRLPHSIDHDHQTIVPTRSTEGARRMGQVMLYRMDVLGRKGGKVRVYMSGERFPG